ncbi:hypothetical protein ACT17_06475 [Mycolicibacterium conceptionense]|uniref:Uncharacterized protein n=1 Tax=Mycolicibacterium conceptionense TaxID=451644 RepID=A0A0J8UH69_9MYCO|nr:hypothetical protein [Mycolicibacterium conceptionense]KMV19715.1 hypothetical protein ACT17_06475 [Mycolicibacterium conceptionense]
MIDPRLEALVDAEVSAGVQPADTAAPEAVPPTESADPGGADAVDGAAAEGSPADGKVDDSAPDETGAPADVLNQVQGMSDQERALLMDAAVVANPGVAPIAEAAKADIRVGADGKLIASPALRAAMRALVPGRDNTPGDTRHRSIGGWLTADNLGLAPVTETSPYFTVSHWHWMSAMGMIRQIPAELGPTFPHLLTSEAQIVHDLKAWSALDEKGDLTAEAAEMFGAITGHANLTVFGTVLLYGQRRDPVELPAELKQYGLEAAVRNVPRVTFVIGVTDKEVVCALLNNLTVVITRRPRRADTNEDAAAAVRDLVDPTDLWPAYPLKAPIILPGAVVDQLASNPDSSKVIDTEPGEDASDEERAADTALREKARKTTEAALRASKTPTWVREAMSEIASATTDATAIITVRVSDVDVSRGEPAAMPLAFLRGKGIVASYPSGSGSVRSITYVPGTVAGITNGIRSLSNAYRGG